MTMNIYDTAAARPYDVKKITSEVERARLSGGILAAPNPFQPQAEAINDVTLVVDDSVSIIPHPLVIGDRVVMDGRPYLKEVQRGHYQVNNVSEYRFQIERALMSLSVQTKGPEPLSYLGFLPGTVFVRWLSNAIGRRLGLPPADQLTLVMLVLFYWMDLTHGGEPMSDSQRHNLLRLWSKKVGTVPSVSNGIIENLPSLTDLDLLVAAIKEHVPSDRTEGLSKGLVLALLGGSWFGTNVNELVAIATEHPPTFIAMVNVAVENRSYRKTTIGTLTYEHSGRGNAEQFQKAIHVWLGDYME